MFLKVVGISTKVKYLPKMEAEKEIEFEFVISCNDMEMTHVPKTPIKETEQKNSNNTNIPLIEEGDVTVVAQQSTKPTNILPTEPDLTECLSSDSLKLDLETEVPEFEENRTTENILKEIITGYTLNCGHEFDDLNYYQSNKSEKSDDPLCLLEDIDTISLYGNEHYEIG